jgi:hypothetical protein
VDIFRIVTFSRGGRPIVQKDIETGTTYAKIRDSFAIVPGDKHPLLVSANRRYGGQKSVGESHDNWAVQASWLISANGGSADQCLANASAFLAQLESIAPGRFIEWRPDGATYSNFFELRGSAKWNPQYQWVSFAGAQVLKVDVVFPVAPLARGYSMDITDPFDVDSKADYTFDAGAAGDVSVTGGALTSVANHATEKRMLHTARGYKYGDVECWLKSTPGATITSFKAGTVFNWIDANNFIEAYVDDNGTNSRLRVDVVLAGVRTNRASVNLAARITSGSSFWIRPRIEGNVVYADHFTSHPLKVAAATTSTTPYTLSAGEAAVVGASTVGKVGLSWIPQSATATITYFRAWPYTYRGQLPAAWPLDGPIIGDAPALCELNVWNSDASKFMVWFGAGWQPTSPVYNLCWNGDFDTIATSPIGWAVTAVTNINGAATSVTKQTAGVIGFGDAAGEVVCPATSGTGTNFRIFRRFRRGVTYTFDVWVYSAAQVTPVVLKFGNAAANDVATSGATALSAAYQKLTVAWTPTADRFDAHIGIVINAATATTFRIDGGEVYEGTVAPSAYSQTEGRGGYPPFGILEAEANDLSLSGLAAPITVDATSPSGFNCTWTNSASPATTPFQWYIDPTLLTADDFAGDEVQVEVWAKATFLTGLTSVVATLYHLPERASGTAPDPRYTAEFGSAGRSLMTPTPDGNRRLYRLGTLTFSVDRDNPQRRLLHLDIKAGGIGTGSSSLDGLILFPARRRAAQASGKAADNTYPSFQPMLSTLPLMTKIVKPDLSGLLVMADANPGPSCGLGGSLLEVPPGNLEVCVRPSAGVPDSPTVSVYDGQVESYANVGVHFGMTPRWQLARDA